MIFSSDDIPDQQLFDRNAIVDLSRVGSTETKALIMGILVLKLQEYRMESGKPNSNLKHVTVLEEAHNLLKRTSTEQTSEGSNLLGKSVEMLSNSIAEMRTYGEGFVIADQSPGLLDMSVIRNTNTKIILRLPDFSDRELVGRAAGLNNDQIVELGKLEKGVASITQSDWLEPVLCKIYKYNDKEDWPCEEKTYKHKGASYQEVKKSVLDCIMGKEIYRKADRIDIEDLRKEVLNSGLDTTVKCDLIEYITVGKDEAVTALRKLAFDFFDAGKAIEASRDCDDITVWANKVVNLLNPSIREYSQHEINLVLALIVYEQLKRDMTYKDLFCRFSEVYNSKGGVF